MSATPKLVSAWRLCRLVLHLVWGVLLAALWLPRLHVQSQRELVRRWSVGVLRILHVTPQISGNVPAGNDLPVMVVANHISWLDIWSINSVCPVRFVSKSEVRDWPVIGWLAVRTRVIFIERARRHDTARVSGMAAKALGEGDAICMFPEGTTSDGTRVLPFRSSLLQAPIDAGVNVLPVAIRYPGENGGVNTGVAYYADITLWQSLCSILAQRQITIELHFLPVVVTQGLDRRQLTHACREAINGQLHPAVRGALGKHAGLRA